MAECLHAVLEERYMGEEYFCLSCGVELCSCCKTPIEEETK